MSTRADAGRVEKHRATLEELTATTGAISSANPHASQNNAAWFDQQTGQPVRSRAIVHRELIREFRAENPHVKADKKAIILAGPPGAGKTTAQEQLFAKTGTTAADWRILNADDFKDRLLKRALADGSYDSELTPPEVAAAEAAGEKIWPRERAALVHEESSILMKQARNQAIRAGENILVDGTLGNVRGGKQLVQALNDAGYKVRIAVVDGPREVTEARVDYRWKSGYENAVKGVATADDPDLSTLGGRWVPAEVPASLYRQGNDESVCTASARAVADDSTAVTEVEIYRIAEAAGTPELVERRFGRSGTSWRIWRSPEQLERHKQLKKKNARPEGLARLPNTSEAKSSSSTPSGGAPRCVVCGRPLRSPGSIARGAGPTCAEAHTSST